MAAIVHTLFNATSVAAAGTATSNTVDVDSQGRLRPVIDQSGANISVTVETSADGGTTWHDLVAYAAGATGAQAIIDLPGVLVRAVASNAGVGAETVTAHLLIEPID